MGGLIVSHGFCASIVRCAWLARGRPRFGLRLGVDFGSLETINAATVGTVESKITGSEQSKAASVNDLATGDASLNWDISQTIPQCLSPQVLHLGASMRQLETICDRLSSPHEGYKG